MKRLTEFTKFKLRKLLTKNRNYGQLGNTMTASLMIIDFLSKDYLYLTKMFYTNAAIKHIPSEIVEIYLLLLLQGFSRIFFANSNVHNFKIKSIQPWSPAPTRSRTQNFRISSRRNKNSVFIFKQFSFL